MRVRLIRSVQPSFQSSPGVVAGCDLGQMEIEDDRTSVSILTRRGGRVRPLAEPRTRDSHQCFNPHPAWWPGATRRRAHRPHEAALFQSSPGVVAGCDLLSRRGAIVTGHVSILTRRGGRVRRYLHRAHLAPRPVSILTRRGGRVRHVDGVVYRRAGYVSILTRRGGRVRPNNFDVVVGPGAVSILTRRGGRVRRDGAVDRRGARARFNPHPAWWPGATPARGRRSPPPPRFNPHPAWWPGAT